MATISVTRGDGSTAEYQVVFCKMELEGYLSDISNGDIISNTLHYGTVYRDKSCKDNEMALTAADGVSKLLFEKGVGLHASSSTDSTVVFNIAGKGYERFEAYVGIRYGAHEEELNQGYDPPRSSVIFRIYVDNEVKPRYESGLMKSRTPAEFVSIDITGASTLRITVDANGDQWALAPETYISNGPLKMIEWVPGSHMTFAKNENYWNADKVTLNSLKFVLMEDSNAAYSAYQTGEVQMIKDIPTEEIPSLQDSPDYHLDPRLATSYTIFNTQKAPFDDAKVRMALSLAVDREYVANTLMIGTVAPATNFVGPGISDAEAGSSFEEVTRKNNGGDFFNVNNYEADLEKAKELLAEAGYPNGEGFPIIEYMTNDAGYNKPVAEYLQSAWKDLGITMDIKIVEWSTFTPTRRAGDFEICRGGWVYDYDDPSNMLNLLASTSGNNDGKYSNPEVDKLLEEARSTADKAEHYEKLHAAENLIMEDAAVSPLVYSSDFYLQNPKLKGTWHSPYGYWYFMYATMEE